MHRASRRAYIFAVSTPGTMELLHRDSSADPQGLIFVKNHKLQVHAKAQRPQRTLRNAAKYRVSRKPT